MKGEGRGGDEGGLSILLLTAHFRSSVAEASSSKRGSLIAYHSLAFQQFLSSHNPPLAGGRTYQDPNQPKLIYSREQGKRVGSLRIDAAEHGNKITSQSQHKARAARAGNTG